jgi:hypothetical protein
MNTAVEDSCLIARGPGQMMCPFYSIFDRKRAPKRQLGQPTIERRRLITGALPEACQTRDPRETPGQREHA